MTKSKALTTTNNKPAAAVAGEIATTGDGRDITAPYVGALRLNDDTVLAARGSSLEVYEQVILDPQVFSCFQQRRLAVISKEWAVDPGATDALSIKAADSLRAQLQVLAFDDITNKMLFGHFYGYAVGECMFGQDGSEIILSDIKVRRARRFAYDQNDQLRLLTMANRMEGELMPERKFWTYRTGADNDDAVYGLGLGHWCYWPAWFKRNGLKFWAIFLDKYGMPTAKGTYPAGATPEERRKLLQALKAIQTDSGISLPEGMAIELIQAARAAGADYSVFHDKMDAALAKVILSQTATTDGTPGKLGNDNEQMQVRDEVAKSDSDLLCASFNRGPATWLTDWNYPGAVPPRVYRNFEKAEDLGKTATRDQSICAMGFEPSEEYIKQTYGDGWTKKAPAPPPPGLVAQSPFAKAANDFAEGAAPLDGLATGAALAASGWEESMTPILAQLQKIASVSMGDDDAARYQDFMRRLNEALPGLDVSKLQERIARFSFQALLGGMVGDAVRPGMGDT